MEYKPLYTMYEVAAILRISRGDVYKLYHAKLLKCLKLGALKVRREELERFLAEAEGKEIDLRSMPGPRSARKEKGTF